MRFQTLNPVAASKWLARWLAGVFSLFVVLNVNWGAVPDRSPADRASGTAVYNAATNLVTDESYVARVRSARHLDKPACIVGINEVIWVDVVGLDAWIKRVEQQRNPAPQRRISDIVPFLDGSPLVGIHPENQEASADTMTFEGGLQTHHLRFTLSRTSKNKNSWSQFLNRPVFKRQMRFSLGFENGDEMPTVYERDNTDPSRQFSLRVIPYWKCIFGILVIGGALWIFVVLARDTDIIRDTTTHRRPDGKFPYSLARCQMAFWFFLVIASFFLLWMVLLETDTLNETVLGLVGISAGTALGAAFIDASNRPQGKLQPLLPAINLDAPRPEIVAQLTAAKNVAEDRLAMVLEQRGNIAGNDQAALKDNDNQQSEIRDEIKVLDQSISYFAYPAWKGVMYDLLAENGYITFHRFQMFVWTLVLGIIFSFHVYSQLAMPEFSATLLGLLGISAGTYIGFKLPGTK